MRQDLTGIGLDRLAGYFGVGALETWRGSRGQLQVIPALSLREVASRAGENGATLLDVRGEGEWRAGHMPGSINIPVAHLDERIEEIPRSSIIVHCQTGPRSAIAASLLRARGLTDVSLFPGGFSEWQAAGEPQERAEV